MTRAAPVPRLVVVTDRHEAFRAGHSLVEVVAAAVEGGARCVLLREKDLPRSERRRLASAVVAVLAPVGGRLVVASDAGLAAEAGADGVHLAAADTWPSPGPTGATGSAGPVGLVGRSCHTVDELRAARDQGAAYATLSPVFASPSKPGYGPVLGPAGLASACAAVPDLPVLALGGVGRGRAAACLAAGAEGVAVMGEVMRAPDPAAAVRSLVEEVAAGPGDGRSGRSPAAGGGLAAEERGRPGPAGGGAPGAVSAAVCGPREAAGGNLPTGVRGGGAGAP